MTGWQMMLERMMPMLLKAIPKEVWAEVGPKAEFLASKIKEFDERLKHYEENQAYIRLHLDTLVLRSINATSGTTQAAPYDDTGAHIAGHARSEPTGVQFTRLLCNDHDHSDAPLANGANGHSE